MSKTREEILKGINDKTGDYGGNDYVMESVALSAMSEYAKQQAIAFRIWMSDMVTKWLSGANDVEDYVKSPIKPLDEYYNLFIEHQNQQTIKQ